MSVSPNPFVIDVGAAEHALVLAEAATRTVLDLRDNPGSGDLHLALFGLPSEGTAMPAPHDAGAVLKLMDQLLIAEHGAAATSAPIAQVGLSKRQIVRLKAFECVHCRLDAYVAIQRRAKFDGATRSFGSHLFAQTIPGGESVTLIAAASGWRAEQDYLAAMMVPATLQSILTEYGVLSRSGIESDSFVLAGGAWAYPAD